MYNQKSNSRLNCLCFSVQVMQFNSERAAPDVSQEEHSHNYSITSLPTETGFRYTDSTVTSFFVISLHMHKENKMHFIKPHKDPLKITAIMTTSISKYTTFFFHASCLKCEYLAEHFVHVICDSLGISYFSSILSFSALQGHSVELKMLPKYCISCLHRVM